MRLFSEPGPRVFTIPPGIPFADALAEGVMARIEAEGLGPEALARLEVVVSTRRATRALRSAFARAGGGVALGPRLRTLGELGAESEVEIDAPRPIAGSERLMSLAPLVRALFLQAPDLGSPTVAPRLAADLAGLLDAAQASGVSLDDLESLTAEDHAAHWALSKRFLDVIRQVWPAILEEQGRIDAAERNRLVVQRLAEQWESAPPDRPILIAGSTGSLDTSAWFIELVSRLPQGAVVLPGLDTEIDDRAAEELASGRAPEHPQAGLFQLLKRMGVDRRAVQAWTEDRRGDGPARLRLLGQALRPAPVTDAWRAAAEAIAGEAPAATSGLSLIEAPGPREEAQAVAVALREALETPGRKAALITPDRTLARRVAAELARWGVAPDDSGGRPLSLTPPGVFFTLLAEAALNNLAATPLLSLLKHPLTSAGQDRGAHSRAARRFEREVLREERPGPGVDPIRRAIAAAEKKREKRDAEGAAGETAVEEAGAGTEAATTPPTGAWFESIAEILAPLLALAEQPEVPLETLVAAHIAAAEALTTEADSEKPDLYGKSAGETLQDFLEKLTSWAGRFGPIAPAEYLALLGQLMSGESVREAYGRHPRVLILGPLEARMQSADLVVLAGLNEGVWPQIPEPDPWISRDMRAGLGLPALESRIGLSAHDFFQAAMAPQAILSRTRKQDGAPTVASRWLLRLTNLLDGLAKDELTAMRARGERHLTLASRLDRAESVASAARPRPKPPVQARPTRFSVTEVETLIRDPYAIYAKKILRLSKLPDFDETPDARDRGVLLHAIVERFVRETMGGLPTPEAARALYDRIAEEELAAIAPWPTLHAVWRARAARIRDWFLETEIERRAEGHPVALESRGLLALETAFGELRLTAFADRIDRVNDSEHGAGFAIYDYKTGAPPSRDQVKQFAKQLPLEGAIFAKAGFTKAGAGPVVRLGFLRLAGGRKGGEERRIEGDPMAVAEEALEGLKKLLAAYANPDQPYLSRARPMFLAYEGDYDHLARLGEWEDGA